MNRHTKLAIGLGSVLALVLLALMIVPLALRGQVEERVKAVVNDNVAAEVDWSRVRLSLIRGFPNFTLRLDDLSVTGVGPFAGDTLASIGRFALVVDAGSLLRAVRSDDPIAIRAISVDRPVVRLAVLEDGTANWDILKESEPQPEDQEGAGLAVSLRKLEIRDATVVLDDRSTGLTASIFGYHQTLTGDFARDSFVLATRADAEEVSLRFGGIPYLSRVRLRVEADVDADMANRRFTLGDNELRLNDLALTFSGAVGLRDDAVDLALDFAAPSTDFRHILSLVPAIYAREFQSLQTAGTMAVRGRVHGEYRDDVLPAFSFRAAVENGSFQYPDLPLPARDIHIDMLVENPGGSIDATVARLNRFRVMIGSDRIDGSLALRTPVSDPDVDFRLAGRLDLAELGRTVKLDSVDELVGVLAADLSARTRLSYVDAGQFDRVTASGGAEVRGVSVRTENLPHAIAIDEATLRLTPQHAELEEFRGRIGASDIRLVGHLDNLLGFVLRDEDLRGSATFQSAHFDLDEWQSDESEFEIVPVPRGIDFALNADVARLSFGELDMRNVRGRVRLKDQRIDLEDLAMQVLGGEIGVSGFYETTDLRRPTFDANLAIRSVDIPTAAATLVTVDALAPVARYAQGNFSAELGVRGALGRDMTPILELLNGQGMLETSILTLQGFPAMARLAESLQIEPLRHPRLEGFRSAFAIRDGRLHVSPFDVNVGSYRLEVAGSNGLDQSLQYALRLHLPRSALGTGANQAIARLASQTGRVGLDLGQAEMIELAAQLTGTVADPSIRLEIGDVVGGVLADAERAIRDQVEQRVDAVERRLDEAAADATRMSQAEIDRILGEAEQRSQAILAEANVLAENVRREGYDQADAILERAGTPVARLAARPAADRLRRESDDRATQILREGERRAESILSEARRRTGTEAPEEPDV